ncbi:MAG: hypothetical protein ACLFSY_08550 [Desulfonatronovibrionaceae bacterium]
MQLNIVEPHTPPPVDRAYAVSMTIVSFKGRRNVQVHLFRPDWDPEEEKQMPWESLLGDPVSEEADPDPVRSGKVIMEAFTREERDEIIDYLQKRYSSRLKSIDSAPLEFPIPKGLAPLSGLTGGENLGIMRLEIVPNYPLPYPVHGFFDLSAHQPIMAGENGE